MGISVVQWRIRIGSFHRVKFKRSTVLGEQSPSSGMTGKAVCLAIVLVLLWIGNIEQQPGPPNKDTLERKVEDILEKITNMEPAIKKIESIDSKVDRIEAKMNQLASEVKGLEEEVLHLKEENDSLRKRLTDEVGS